MMGARLPGKPATGRHTLQVYRFLTWQVWFIWLRLGLNGFGLQLTEMSGTKRLNAWSCSS